MLSTIQFNNSHFFSMQYPYDKYVDKTREYFNRVFVKNNWIEQDLGNLNITDDLSGIRWYRHYPDIQEYVPASGSPYGLANTPLNTEEFWRLSESGVSYTYQHTPSLSNPHSVIFGNSLNGSSKIGQVYHDYYDRHQIEATPQITTNNLNFYSLAGTKGVSDYIDFLSGYTNTDRYNNAYDWLVASGQVFSDDLYATYLSTDYTASRINWGTSFEVYKKAKQNFNTSNDGPVVLDPNRLADPYLAPAVRNYQSYGSNFMTALIPLSRSCFVGVDGLQTNYSLQNLFDSLDITLGANLQEILAILGGGFGVPFAVNGATQAVLAYHPYFFPVYDNAVQYLAHNKDGDDLVVSVGFINSTNWLSTYKDFRHNYFGAVTTGISNTDNDVLVNLVAEDIKAGNNTIITTQSIATTYTDLSVYKTSLLLAGGIDGDYYRSDHVKGYGDTHASVSYSNPTYSTSTATIPPTILQNTSHNTFYIAIHMTNLEAQSSVLVHTTPKVFGTMIGSADMIAAKTGRNGVVIKQVDEINSESFEDGEAGWKWNEKMYPIS